MWQVITSGEIVDSVEVVVYVRGVAYDTDVVSVASPEGPLRWPRMIDFSRCKR